MAKRLWKAALSAEQTADGLDAFFRDRPMSRSLAGALWTTTGPDAVETDSASVRPEPCGSDPPEPERHVPFRLAHTDWLFHHLAIDGPLDALNAFADAAIGAGTVPWAIDFDQAEEDWVHRLIASRDLSMAGSRILARQLRDAAERRHTLAVARVGRSRACPLDLHSLVAVPNGILALGPDHPDSAAWLWEHWGTTEPLRHVVALKPREGQVVAGLRLGFWSADWSPWRALRQIQDNWPVLRFGLRPRYGDA